MWTVTPKDENEKPGLDWRVIAMLRSIPDAGYRSRRDARLAAAGINGIAGKGEYRTVRL